MYKPKPWSQTQLMFALVRMTIEMRLGLGKDLSFEQVDYMIEKLLTPTLDPPIPDSETPPPPPHVASPEEVIAAYPKETKHAETPRPHYQSPPKTRGRPPKSRPF
jgi:hypothetical protein